MINKSELRIGNKIKFGALHTGIGGYSSYTISELQETVAFFKESNTGEYYHDLEPIPLTEDVLLKAGFEKKPGMITWDKDKLSINIGDTIFSGKEGRTYFNSWAILEYAPKYVHQLQNLYFALTGEELTINLNQ